jgi:hypothetical protein
VDVQPSHSGSSLHRREFGFLFSEKQNRCRGFPYRIFFQKNGMQVLSVPWSCAGFYEWLVVMLVMLLLDLDQVPLVLALLLPRWLSLHLLALGSPPCLPYTSLVLGLLLASPGLA